MKQTKQGKMTDWITSSKKKVIVSKKVTKQVQQKKMIQKDLLGWSNKAIKYTNLVFPFPSAADPEPDQEEGEQGRGRRHTSPPPALKRPQDKFRHH